MKKKLVYTVSVPYGQYGDHGTVRALINQLEEIDSDLPWSHSIDSVHSSEWEGGAMAVRVEIEIEDR